MHSINMTSLHFNYPVYVKIYLLHTASTNMTIRILSVGIIGESELYFNLFQYIAKVFKEKCFPYKIGLSTEPLKGELAMEDHLFYMLDRLCINQNITIYFFPSMSNMFTMTEPDCFFL